MKRLRILFMAPSMAGGGSERVFANLLNHLDRERFEPVLALVEKKGPFLAELPGDVEVLDLGASRARYAPRRIVSLVRRTRPDVVFSTLGYLNLVIMLCRPFMPRGVRFVARESIVPSVEMRAEKASGYFRLLYRLLYPRFDCVVCQSRDMRDDLVQNFGLPEGKAVVINNPVDTQKFAARCGDAAPPTGKGAQLTAMGRLTPQKGFDLLLRAGALLQEQGREFSLAILGEGQEQERLEALATELDIAQRVGFPGFQADPSGLLARSNVFVLSSRYEGFPNAVLEALACGAPVAAFACPGGLNEIITPGLNGCLAQPENPADLARCIAELLDAPLDREELKRDVAARFGMQAIVQRYEEVFAEVAGG